MSVKAFNYFTLFIIAITIFALFNIKEKVSLLDYQLQTLSTQINHERNNIHLLKAEHAYLTTPGRIKTLASLYLKLDTVKPHQLISNPLSPDINKFKWKRYTAISSSNKWRYKKAINNKYIQTVSTRVKSD